MPEYEVELCFFFTEEADTLQEARRMAQEEYDKLGQQSADAWVARHAYYAVQFSSGGIPQDPELFTDRDEAQRRFVAMAVANELEFTDDCNAEWIGNDDDEVRMWGPIAPAPETRGPPADPVKYDFVDTERGHEYLPVPFTAEEREKFDSILLALRGQKEDEAMAREVLAEDSTPDRPGGCD